MTSAAIDSAAMDLGPVEAGKLAVALSEEEPQWIKPGLAFAQIEVSPGPGPLFRMTGERAMVERDPLVFVLPDNECSDRYAISQLRSADACLQRPAHLPQRAGPLESSGCREPSGRSQIAVSPQPQPRVAGLVSQRLPERQPETFAPSCGVNDHLSGRALDRISRVEVPVACQPAVVADQHVSGPWITAISQVQHDVL